MFLGQARRSVGDVTFYVSNGQQRSRVRRRVIKNPRSLAQQAQRAALSNVSQLYSAGREIFDHAFEGYTTAATNQKRFLQLNVNRLKALILADYEKDPAECLARIGARGLSVAVPFVGLQVSQGSYEQSAFVYNDTGHYFKLPETLTGDTTSETVGSYARRVGLLPSDIYTFVGFKVSSDSPIATFWPSGRGSIPTPPPEYAKLYGCQFFYAQLLVKDDVLSSTDTINDSSFLNVLFNQYGGIDITGTTIDDGITISDLVFDRNGGGFACIRSKVGTNLRSTSYLMQSKEDAGFANGMNYGLTVNSIDLAWQDPETDSSEDKILSGENF